MAVDVRGKEEQTLDGKIEYRVAECQRCGFETSCGDALFCVVSDDMTKKWSRNDSVTIKNGEDAEAFMFCADCTADIFGDDVARGNYQRGVRRFLADNNMTGTVVGFFLFGVLFGSLVMYF